MTISMNETRMFFCAATELRAAIRAGSQGEIDDLVDELEVMKLQTDSDAIRRGCSALLATAEETAAKIANGAGA